MPVPETKTIGFSLQMSTVYLEHRRVVGRCCRTGFGLTYDEFSLMLAVAEADGRCGVDDLADYLILGRSTVLGLLSGLEDRGLVVKLRDPADARFMRLELSQDGERVTRACLRAVRDALNVTFWNNLPLSELRGSMQRDTQFNLSYLRGHDAAIMPRQALGKDVLVDTFVFMRVVVERWRAEVRRCSKLNFNEFRVLKSLEEEHLVTPSDLAGRLRIARSHLTGYKETLLKRGFARQTPNPLDGRGCILEITASGASECRMVLARLDDVTRAAHMSVSNGGVEILEAWLYRMYLNVMCQSG